jgi:glc operon protein GlcG
MPDKSPLPFAQIRKAMDAMIDHALKDPDSHVSIAIVDDAGNLLAFAKTGHMRLFGRRHAVRKAYSSAILGMDTGAHAEKLHASGRSISELGDPNLTFGQGGVVIIRDGVILGGIGVGGYPSGKRDEELAKVGLEALGR